MRLRFYLTTPKGNGPIGTIPMDFRRHCISFVKSILEPYPVFERFEQDRPGFSPYVLGLYRGNCQGKRIKCKSISDLAA
ncbi:hypothetical protein SCACP_10980 [Sporomusa carbonis]